MSKEKKLTAIYYDGKVLVNNIFLSHLFNVDRSTVTKWFSQKGAEKSGYKSYTDLWYMINWHRSNIDTSHSNRSRKQAFDDPLSDNVEYEDWDEFLKTLPPELALAFRSSNKDDLDKMRDLKVIEKQDIENKTKSGKLVPAEKLDVGMAELCSVQIGLYRQDLRVIPREVSSKLKSYFLEKHEMKIQDTVIEEIVEEVQEKEYKKRISDLSKIAHIKSNSKISDLLDVISEKLVKHSADDIIKVLNEL